MASNIYILLGRVLGVEGCVECLKEMDKVRVSSYVVTKTATNSMPIPSVPEFIALVVSNVAAFVYGVFHGKKKP